MLHLKFNLQFTIQYNTNTELDGVLRAKTRRHQGAELIEVILSVKAGSVDIIYQSRSIFFLLPTYAELKL